MKVSFGVCSGRHEIPGIDTYVFDSFEALPTMEELENRVEEFFKKLFPNGEDHKSYAWWETFDDHTYTDMGKSFPDVDVDMYVTGFTPMALAIIRVCQKHGYALTAYHYDKDKNEYYPQRVLDHWSTYVS